MADTTTESKKLSRKDFGNVVAAGLGGIAGLVYGESHKDYSGIGYDPEIRDAMERQGIGEDINLRIYVGDHFFTENTATKMQEQGVTILTGEIGSNPFIKSGETTAPDNLIREFLANLTKLPNGVRGKEQMIQTVERSERLLKEFSESRAVLISDTSQMTASNEASNRVLIGWAGIGSLVYLSEIARESKILTDFNQPISRREFFKKGGIGLGVLFALPIITSAIAETAQNRGIYEPSSSEVSYIFSKLFNTVGDISTKYLEMTSDNRLVQAFQSLVSVRNKIMALNNWYLIESLERNTDVKQTLIGSNGNVEIGIFGGFVGHTPVKYEFCKGPGVLAEELKSTVSDWLSQYQTDMYKAGSVEEKQKVLDYYTGLMTMLNKPELISKHALTVGGVKQGNYIPSAETPAAIMYRTLIEKVSGEKSDGTNTGIYNQLIGSLLKDLDVFDGTHFNVGGDLILSEGKYHGEMKAKDAEALKKRFIDTHFISEADLEKTEGEIYPNLYSYDYIGPVVDKSVSVGLAIVRGMPMTFFQKEDTSFITHNTLPV